MVPLRGFSFIVLAALMGMGPSGQAAEIRAIDSPELGGQALILEGQIEKGDGRRLPTVIDQIMGPDARSLKFVILNSPGGVVGDAQEIGRYLRVRGYGTAVLPGGRCDSACADLFFAGYDLKLRQPKRVVFPSGRVGVHQAFPVMNTVGKDKLTLAEVAAVYAQIQRELGIRLRYLQQMDAGADIIARMLETTPKAIFPLPVQALAQSRVLIAISLPGGWKLEGAPADMDLFPTVLQRVPYARDRTPPDAGPPPPAAGDLPADKWEPSLPPPKVDTLRANLAMSTVNLQMPLQVIIRLIEARHYATALTQLDRLPPEDANGHYLRAVALIGQAHNEGAGLPELLRASDLNHPRAINLAAMLFLLGRGTPKDPEQAFALWKRGAALGDKDCQWELASRFYYLGLAGKGDLTEARRLLEALAAQGMPQAINALGQMNETGRGVPVNPAAAVGHYLRAAQMGDPLAMVNLGRLFKSGTGVPRDSRQFLLWTERSADTGHPPALFALGKSLIDGDAGVTDIDRGIGFLKRASARDSGPAMALLAELYLSGRGVPRLPVLAQVLRKLAEARSSPMSDQSAQQLDAALSAGDRQRAEGILAFIAADPKPAQKD